MKIALIGYGKMGKAIEEIALIKEHDIVLKIDVGNVDDFTTDNLKEAEVAIEFTGAQSAADNIKQCIKAGIPVVSGSTGWLAKWDDVSTYCKDHDGALVYASNYSIGVNIFFELNTYLSRLMSLHSEYEITLEEIHHTEKKDAPSGTAITLAEQVLENIKRKKNWVNSASTRADELEIISRRIDPAAGTHSIKYTSLIDNIEIIHTAHNRKGFAGGAVLAAEFIREKKGIFNMRDVLGL